MMQTIRSIFQNVRFAISQERQPLERALAIHLRVPTSADWSRSRNFRLTCERKPRARVAPFTRVGPAPRHSRIEVSNVQRIVG